MSAASMSRVEEPAGGTDRIPFMDLGWQWRHIADDASPALQRLFLDSAFCLGPWVEKFETTMADRTKMAHAVGVNSGTSALHLAMIAAGIGPGDEVLVPANTFIASLWPVLYAGAVPILCDVDPQSWTIDPADAAARITSRTRAIVPVHLYGQFAPMSDIMDLARRHGLSVIEDAAQAFGADLDGKAPGQLSGTACFSFYPGKNLGAAGEGGMVVTSDHSAAERMKRLRNHGQAERYVHTEVGYNYRMEGIQGLVLSHKLRHFDAWMEKRQALAAIYLQELATVPVELPKEVRGRHAWHLFVIHTPRRDALQDHLHRAGIATGLHYPVPLHRQPCLSDLASARARFPNAERNAAECLSLPLFPGMSDGQIGRVIAAIRGFFGS